MFNFQALPFSGYLLCYGPLALVLLGFIAAAIVTDGKARRTYLRRLDPRPEAERVDEGAIAISGPVDALTPSGVSVRLLPVAAPVAPAMPAPPPARVASVVDNLQRIEGVGPKIAAVLGEAGITSFAQVAQASAERLRQILDEAGMAAIHDTRSWPEQARLAAAGSWDELQTLQDSLRGGRDVK
ncbi:MAG: DUF4332 domain-containing protein [Anaerolineales bacterium]|nr:DUF4332 domain-containing protein [Anaerolineales bacterium]MCB0004811.1 DUF4332 domain-containing protein [Anaerolineales bacterium]MCB0010480.1 DUF4332 domain-containing protein [Anaerolineales bacterium]MCB0017640.1 DUF4332 domain-containing protein [Anaerolineales bacterium]MCB8960989.1 DUF4332 domain-containing protein [Ardenticatenales bacterium]